MRILRIDISMGNGDESVGDFEEVMMVGSTLALYMEGILGGESLVMKAVDKTCGCEVIEVKMVETGQRHVCLSTLSPGDSSETH
jgi:hypothetical protein